MQFKYSTLAVVALSGLAAAQVSAIPACAQTCIEKAIAASPCASTDTACQCETANKNSIQAAATPCVESACTSAEILQVLAATTALCSSTGTTSSSSSAAAPPSSSSSVAPSSSASAPTTSAPATSAPATLTTTTSSTKTECPCEETSATATSNGTATASIVPFTGAASQMAATFGSVFAIGFAVLAAF